MSVRSLGTAASGIDTMQTDLDTIGNDIANSETDGFVSQTAQFSDLLTEQLQPAGGAVGRRWPARIPPPSAPVTKSRRSRRNSSAGAVTQTGIKSNVAIEGNGFLVVTQDDQTYYTLDGDLQVDSNGNLATNSGGLVEGWAPGNRRRRPPPPSASSWAPPAHRPRRRTSCWGEPAVQRHQSGDHHHHDVRLARQPGPGDAHPDTDGGRHLVDAGHRHRGGPTPLDAPADSRLRVQRPAGLTQRNRRSGPARPPWPSTTSRATTPGPGRPSPPSTSRAVGSEGAVTQFADDQTIEVTSQDGNAAGTLESYSIGSDGVITGTYSNGDSQSLGTIALAQFANPDGLDDIGQTYFTPTVASGKAQLGEPGDERPRHTARGSGRGLERRPGHRAHRPD